MNTVSIKILVLEDNDFDFELVDRKLKSMGIPYLLKRAICERDLRDFLSEFSPDLILSDYSIPSYSGLEALNYARVHYPDIPFIFVSGTIGEERAVEALTSGAIDYVLKDNLNKLEPAVRRALREAEERAKRKEAEEKVKLKNKELRTLIYRISHDIRGPICSIKSASGLDLEVKKKKELVFLMGLIEEVAKKLDSTVINLSNFHYLYADEITITRINIKEFSDDLTISLSLIDGFKDIDFKLKLEGINNFLGENNILLAILYNLIQNAVVFYDKGKEEHYVSCTIQISDKSLNLIVEDNGIGIPSQIKGKVCEMFYRGSNASKGAGLGLYIVKTGVDLLNGKMTIDSQEGKGTKVTICIDTPDEKLVSRQRLNDG